MTRPIDVLDQQESLRRPLVLAAGFHIFVVALFAGINWLLAFGHEPFGSPDAIGGSVGISSVHSIPLPNRPAQPNPVAADTESHVPTPPPKPVEQKKEPKPDPKAIEIGTRTKAKKPNEREEVARHFQPHEDRPNQLHSRTGEAISTPMLGGTPGAGGVGVGQHSSLGNRFGAYEDLIRERVAQNWHTGEVDPRVKTAPPVIVTFDLQRDGSIRNIVVMQRSGNTTLDFSAQRAIQESSPFPPLPPAYQADSARIEFWFQLKR
jgi:protein TonB